METGEIRAAKVRGESGVGRDRPQKRPMIQRQGGEAGGRDRCSRRIERGKDRDERKGRKKRINKPWGGR